MADTDSLLATILQSAGLLILGRFFELGISFGAKILMARFLGKTNYGAVSIGISLLLLTSTVGLLGLHVGVGRYLPRYDDVSDVWSVLYSAATIIIPASLLISAATYFGAEPAAQYIFSDPSVAPVLQVFALAIPFVVLMKFGIGAAQGFQTTWPKVTMEMVSMPIVRFGGIIVALSIGLGVVGVSFAYVLSYAVPAAIGIYYLARHAPVSLDDFTPESRHRELLVFSVPLMFSGLMGFVFSDIDTLMLGYFANVGEVGVYNVIYPVSQLVIVFVTPMTFLFMPIMSKLHSDGHEDEMDRLFKTMTKWMVVASTPVFILIVVFPEIIIGGIFGDVYLSGTLPLIVLTIGFFVHILAGPARTVLQSVHETRFIMWANLATAIVNMVLNVVLIPRYGIMGAAIATGAAYATLNALTAGWLYYVTGMTPITTRTLKFLSGMGAYTLISIIILTTVPRSLPVVAIILLQGTVLYTVLGLRYGVQSEEVALLLRFEEHAGIDLGTLKAVANRFVK